MFGHKRTIVTATLLLSLIFIVQVSNSSKPTEEVVAADIDSVQVNQDSLFAQINRNFETVKSILE